MLNCSFVKTKTFSHYKPGIELYETVLSIEYRKGRNDQVVENFASDDHADTERRVLNEKCDES